MPLLSHPKTRFHHHSHSWWYLSRLSLSFLQLLSTYPSLSSQMHTQTQTHPRIYIRCEWGLAEIKNVERKQKTEKEKSRKQRIKGVWLTWRDHKNLKQLLVFCFFFFFYERCRFRCLKGGFLFVYLGCKCVCNFNWNLCFVYQYWDGQNGVYVVINAIFIVFFLHNSP